VTQATAPKTFFDDAAKARIRTLVAEVERGSAAEIVVAVHPDSAPYREVEWLAGTAVATTWLLLFLYLPESFDFTFLPVELAICFMAGMLLVRMVGPLKRLLARSKTMEHEVDRTAKTLFHDLGITRTRGRTGILVFASMLEGRVVVLRDGGIPKIEAFDAIQSRLDAAARARDFAAFEAALATLGPELERALPRTHDDENELVDELVERTKK
jgi:putative membrane protein